ncbi:MAG: esterase [Bdellovibrionia bacterium]
MRRATKKILVGLAAGAVLLGGVWMYAMQPSGRARVQFEKSARECAETSNGWKYCVNRAPQGTAENSLIYHLHGRGQDETVWNDDDYYTGQIQKYWSERGIKPPVVVSVSKGPVWFLAPKSANEQSGLLEEFTDVAALEIEKRLGMIPRRVLIGESMGGLNSLLISFKRNMFAQKVAALCPPIYKGSPFDSWSELRAFLARTGADPRTMLGVLSLAKLYVKDPAEWHALSPITLLEKAVPQTAPKYYVSCGLYDKYGNYEGVDEWIRRALDRGLTVEWHPLYGGHCATDIASAAEFIAK